MNILFQQADSNCYASMPQTEKRADGRIIRFSHAGCTGYLLLQAPLSTPIDLSSAELQDALRLVGDALNSGRELPLPGTDRITVRYLSRAELHRGNDHAEIRDEAANHAVCGVWESGSEFRVILPAQGMRYTTAVAVELSYSSVPHMVTVRKRFFRQETVQSDFYRVTFDQKINYSDGMVYYTIGTSKFRFPVTEKMMGRTVLIKTNKQCPEFHSANAGVILKKR